MLGSVTIDDYNYLNNMISIPVSSNDGMTREANGYIAGNKYSISILRNGKKQDVEFDIISGPEQFVVGATSVVALSSELGIVDVDEAIFIYNNISNLIVNKDFGLFKIVFKIQVVTLRPVLAHMGAAPVFFRQKQ